MIPAIIGLGLSIKGFFEFYARPFKSLFGWFLLLLLGFWIFMRVTGRWEGIKLRRGGDRGGGQAPDYRI